VLSLFWLFSGTLGLLQADAASAILVQKGIGSALAMATVLAGSILDIALAAMCLVRFTHRIAVLGMTATTLAYLAAGTVLTPELWLDPLGPLVKTIPGAMLALVALAIAYER